MEKFSFDTINNFDEHISLSIPNYNGLVEHIVNLSTYFVKDYSTVYDLGCSTGKLIEQLKHHNKKDNCIYIGVDNCKNLIGDNENIVEDDIITMFFQKSCLFTCIFTLQFLPLHERLPLLKRVYDSLDEGGALIVAEKIFAEDGVIQDMLNFSYYDFKMKNFTPEEIISKQLSLRYIMKPLTEEQNLRMFKEAGFHKVESIWQSLLFKAWILIK